MQDQHPDETFYAFGLFHEPLWAYIIPSASSEEGLTWRAEKYQRDPYELGYSQQSIEHLRVNLRWSSGDWSYHNALDEHFASVNDWLTKTNIYDLMLDRDLNDFHRMNDRMISICRMVLRKLDEEGLFGQDDAREQTVLNIVMGDQDRSWLEHARLLNSPTVYERWLAEIKQAGKL